MIQWYKNLVCIIAFEVHTIRVERIDVGSGDVAIACASAIKITKIISEDSNYMRRNAIAQHSNWPKEKQTSPNFQNHLAFKKNGFRV